MATNARGEGSRYRADSSEEAREGRTTSLGGGLIRSSCSDSLAAVLGPTSEPHSPPSTTWTSRTNSPSPPSTAPSSHSLSKPTAGFHVVSRAKSYHPPASLPSSSPPTPASPVQRGSLSHNPSGSSSFRSRRASPPAPFRIDPATQHSATLEAKTTHTLSSSVDANGRRMVNQYVRLKTIGQGSHGKVWLCVEPNSKESDDSLAEANWDEEGMENLSCCAIKSVAREGGRGKSLRHAKGKKSAATSAGIGSDDQVKREVAIMKRLDHRNVVRLKEVIDDVKSKKVFMVLEFMAGGQIVWQDAHKQPMMTVDEARRTFRDVVLGLEYLHYQGIIHRDIKPANLLWTEDHSLVKISDFGVSHVSDALLRATPGAGEGEDDRALRMTAGSPAFFAPELCHPAESTPSVEQDEPRNSYFGSDAQSQHSPATPGSSTKTVISPPLRTDATTFRSARPAIGKGIDVWALGVTLYCLLFGDTPFMARTEYELYNVIVKEGITVPETMGKEEAWTGVGTGWKGCGDGSEGRDVVDLLSRLLEKDPAKRISLSEVKQHPWVLRNLESPETWLSDTDPAHSDTLVVTEEDVKRATQTRGTADDLPRIRPSIRRALNAALDRFSRRKEIASDRARSKSAGSTGPDSEATAGSIRGGKLGDPHCYEGSTTPSAHSSPFLRGGGGGIGRWGSRQSKKSESSGGRDLDRSSSNQSFANGLSFPHHLLPSSHKNSSRDGRGSEMSDYPSSREGSPLPPPVDQDMSASRRQLHKVFSVFGGRAKPVRADSMEDSTVVLPKSSAEVDDRAVYASRRRAEPIPIPATTADEVDSTEFEYSSDEDHEEELEHESPSAQADNVLGWQSGFTHFADDIAAGFEDAPGDQPRYFVQDETTPRSSAQHSNRTEYAPSPTSREFDVASKGSNARDGSIREGVTESNPKRWEVHSDDEEEEEGEEIFVAPRRRRLQPGS